MHGAGSLWRTGYEKGKHAVYAVHDGTQARLVETAAFLDEAPPGEQTVETVRILRRHRE